MSLEFTEQMAEEFRQSVMNDPTARLGMNACAKTDPLEVCTQRLHSGSINHIFTHKVETEGKPVSNQKSTGRCWMFAGLNVMRLPFMKHLNIDEFEFSQSYLFFWDKIERINYNLNKMLELAKRGEEVDSRLMSFLLSEPVTDAGQWDMLVNTISRYGLMPKKCFPECFSSESSMRMNGILTSKFREYTQEIRTAVKKGSDDDALANLLKRQLSEMFRIVSICLGIPPKTFTWEYYDKNKAYAKIGPITPLEFYETHVKPHFNVENKVCLVSDPRESSPFNATFTIDCLGNMVNGRQVKYLNQPVEVLMTAVAESIKNNEAVWFGSEVGKRFGGKLGIQDLELHDYKTLFGVEVNMGLCKADRLTYGDSLMTHAMAFTAVTLDDEGKPQKWRVENSWGEDRGEKGYNVLTSDWFREFVFEVVVDKAYLPEDILAMCQKDPIVLPAWDPMGYLARLNV